ncbi:MAG: hypothetical protein DWQ05_12670 [Calditrichaeota bacterium]|nr:MAG: hypothetical protein DWQ05_12670 [Calditrichota bacterium]
MLKNFQCSAFINFYSNSMPELINRYKNNNIKNLEHVYRENQICGIFRTAEILRAKAGIL